MWKLLSFVLRSKQRQQILAVLKQPRTPTQIASKTKLATSHVSRALKEFMGKGLVECMTPNERAGKIYRRTKKGNEIAKAMEE